MSLIHVHLNISLSNKSAVMEFLYEKMRENDLVEEGYLDSLNAREAETCTYLKNGVVIPHGRKSEVHMVKKTGLIVVQCKPPVDWDGDPATVVVGIAANAAEHIPVMEKLTQVVLDEEKSNLLANTSNVQDFFDALLPS